MASKRDYAYYIKGNKIAIIEQGIGSGVCSLSGYSNQTTCEAAGGTWTENAVSRDDGKWMSPIATVTDGLEIQYAYSPEYRINQAATTVACDRYTNSNGLLKIVDAGNGLPTSGVTHIVIDESEKWNGLHEVNTLNAGYTILETKYNGGSVTEAFTVYTDVDALNNELDTIDLPEYLAKGLVYYVKAKLAEDIGDIDQKEYNMKEFRRILEKHESSKMWGPRMMIPGAHGIR